MSLTDFCVCVCVFVCACVCWPLLVGRCSLAARRNCCVATAARGVKVRKERNLRGAAWGGVGHVTEDAAIIPNAVANLIASTPAVRRLLLASVLPPHPKGGGGSGGGGGGASESKAERDSRKSLEEALGKHAAR